MKLYYDIPSEIDERMAPVTETRRNFPGLETQKAPDAHRATGVEIHRQAPGGMPSLRAFLTGSADRAEQ